MRTLQFTKYHGLGNDFIIVDTELPGAWTAEQARSLCDRHRGIGADGVLLVGPPVGGARASMRVLNADGSGSRDVSRTSPTDASGMPAWVP